MNREQIKKLGNELMTEHGLIQKGWLFVLDSAKRRMGCCKYRPKHITVSWYLAQHVDQDHIIDTILHEIAHALVGRGNGHNYVWRAKAREIGAKDSRCYNSDEVFNEGAKNTLAQQSKYYLHCSKCGRKTPKHRKPKVARSCGCNPIRMYNEEYKLTLVQNY